MAAVRWGVDIPLEASVMVSLSRRGRKKLKQLEAEHKVSLQLDRSRGVLNAVGPTEGVRAVQKLIKGMVGPRRSIPAPLWAELLRTRIMEGPECLVDQVQRTCDCRVHIERTEHEIRIFGDDEAVERVEALLAELAPLCSERRVLVEHPGQLSPYTLEAMAEDLEVSLQLDGNSVVVLGMAEQVEAAVAPIQKYAAEPHAHPKHATEQDRSCSTSASDEGSSTSPSSGGGTVSQQSQHHKSSAAPAVPAGGWPGACPTCGCGSFCRLCGAKVGCDPGLSPDHCPTCGCGKFCHQCGAPVPPVLPQEAQARTMMMMPMGMGQWGAGMPTRMDNQGSHGMVMPMCMVPNMSGPFLGVPPGTAT